MLKKEYQFPGRVLAGLLAAGAVWMLVVQVRAGEFSWPSGVGIAFLVVLLVYAFGGRRVLQGLAPWMLERVSKVEIWLLLLLGLGLLGIVIAMASALRQAG
jgi:hypothetical protein